MDLEKQQTFQLINFGRLQELVTILKIMDDRGLTRKDLEDFVAREKLKASINLAMRSPDRALRNELDKLRRKCPKCGKMLTLYPVTEKNKQGWQSRWFCESGMKNNKGCTGCEDDETDYTQGCGYEELDKRSVREINEIYGKKTNDIVMKHLEKKNKEKE